MSSHLAYRMLPLVAVLLALSGEAKAFPADPDITLAESLTQGESTLNDMFREVEELMKDTQHKLEEAVHQIDNESVQDVDDFPPDYHNESSTDSKAGNTSFHTVEKIDKVTDNETGATFFSKTVITSSSSEGGQMKHECIVNEDCGNGNYCQSGLLQSKCLPCKMQDSNCTRDEECCEGHLCVWGQCVKSSIKGGPGTICEYQSDCNRELCCAFYKALLFPVCTALPKEGEHCHDPSNPLLDLLSWDQEPEGPHEYCPCTNGLSCQSHGSSSICEKQNDSSKEENLPFFDQLAESLSWDDLN
ncbi:dickkopf-related protein 3b isoform X1 [Acipenser oxyrinchus oxyrinchus]|uniref:Dickkopf-related protein 3b isoform X1 n=1 Tax=Acipenser oxyrinchus oxyrinchus TaxID=40147 RepID=A0AAD8CX93_ACIOX|nr:dickkopf-related protein 3b isoform X1 [Acipenser oxyrinchus oxyrinchus]